MQIDVSLPLGDLIDGRGQAALAERAGFAGAWGPMTVAAAAALG